MVRKGSVNFKVDQNHRPEEVGRVCKTPRVILEKLNIPVDSVVLVRGDSIIYTCDNSAKKSDVIDITLSDDGSEDSEVQQILIQKYPSKSNWASCDSKQTGSAHQAESIGDYKLLPEKSSTISEDIASSSVKDMNVIDSLKTNLPETHTLQKTILQKTNKSGKVTKLFNKQVLIKNVEKGLLTLKSAKKRESEEFLNLRKEDNFPLGNTEEELDNSKDSTNVCNNTVGKKTSSIKSLSDHHEPNGNISRGNNSGEAEQDMFSLKPLTVEADTYQASHMLHETLDDVHENPEETGGNISDGCNKIDATPSRISQRIKNKKVKFSALKLLAGGDIYSLRKDILLENIKKSPQPKKIVSKTKTYNAADIDANNSSLSTTNEGESFCALSSLKEVMTSSTPKKILRVETSEGKKKLVSSNTKIKNSSLDNQKKSINEADVQDQDVIVLDQASETSLSKGSNNECITSNEKLENSNFNSSSRNNVELRERKLNGSPIYKSLVSMEDGRGKIRLELKGAPLRKVVNINFSPSRDSLKKQESQQNNLEHNVNVELGPDITISRIRKQVNDHSVAASEIRSPAQSIMVHHSSQSVGNTTDVRSKNLVVKNLLYADKGTKSGSQPAKEVEIPPQIKKLLLESKNPVSFQTTDLTTKTNLSVSNNAKETTRNYNSFSKKKKKFGEFNRRKGSAIRKQKLISKEKMEGLKNKIHRNEVSSKDRESETSGGTSDREMPQFIDSSEQELNEIQVLDSTLEEDDSFKVVESSEMVDMNAKKSPSKGNNVMCKETKVGENKNISKDVESSNILKVGGKKTAKVTPLRQVNRVQPRNELFKKTNSDKMKLHNEKEFPKIQKSTTVPKLSSPSELCLLGGKRNYRNAFEKYFICTEKICECNDLDSDSGSEDTLLLSHFIDLKSKGRENEEINANQNENSLQGDAIINCITEQSCVEDVDTDLQAMNPACRLSDERSGKLFDCHEKGNMREVIKGITADLPKWSWHVVPESSLICLILLEREESGTLDVKKCIEVDCNFKTNVYVDKNLVNEYCGVYDSFDSIKNLIYQVDLL